MKYTHVVIDNSFNNFDVGTEVYLVGPSVFGICMISDGDLVKMCHEAQLKPISEYERNQA